MSLLYDIDPTIFFPNRNAHKVGRQNKSVEDQHLDFN